MMKLFYRQSVFRTTSQYFVVLWFFSLAAIFLVTGNLAASPADDLKNSLRQQMDELQRQIDNYRSSITGLQNQGKTLKREIALFDSKIKTAELEIRRTNLAIQQTESEIVDKNVAIGQAEDKLVREKELLGEYLQIMYESDDQGILEIFLVNEKLSDAFDKINSLENVQRGLQESMIAIRQLKIDLENGRVVLEDRREELNQLKTLQQLQRQTILSQQEEKRNLLNQTKGQESNYQTLLNKAKADVDSIRKNLYLLEGVGLSMTLENAYQYAKKSSDLTGTRPAFLLAILKKESSWGQSVGTGTWRKDMHKRDQAAFIEICDKLGLNPDKAPVSRKPSYGWGGAMGPAQFLPSTWLAYEERVAQLTGHNPPDPWDIEDAFVAAGLKLAQGGAAVQTYQAEWKAAQLYFAGKNWNNPTYYFYGDQVMELAAVIQEQLDIITK